MERQGSRILYQILWPAAENSRKQGKKMKDLLSLRYWNKNMISNLISHTSNIKKNPKQYSNKLHNKTMLMIFEKPSLRTRVSFEVGMTQLGGHAIHLDAKDSPLGKKESIEDTAKASSRYADIIMARVFNQDNIEKLAKNSSVPVINGLTDIFHPCQILSDLFTIHEKKKKLKGLKLCYVGDGNNNVTHSLLLGCTIMGVNISIGCPKKHKPLWWVIDLAQKKAKKSGSKIEITTDAKKAALNADVVYTDSWMSYHIPKGQEKSRLKIFKPFQVNQQLMKQAKKNAIFMNCLPAMRGQEQTTQVIDGNQSIVFDQAENRLHMQKAIVLKLLHKV
jgi:ornithine carbamoyltransferase